MGERSSPGKSAALTAESQRRTPMYEAMNGSRYQRQQAVKLIQKLTSRKLICYVAGRRTLIDPEDVLGFEELLTTVALGDDVDLLLHTSGGDVDTAEKIMSMVRARIGSESGSLRVVVPHYAKSAGTLMALNADSILMSDSSELGPIDPQIKHRDSRGVATIYSASLYIAAYEQYAGALREDPADEVAQIMMNKLDPVVLALAVAATTRARLIAEGHLTGGMFRDPTGSHNHTRTASMLLDPTEYLSHGQMINHVEASGPKLGLVVEYLSPTDEVWAAIWRLFCLQSFAIDDSIKLFESDYVSLPLAGPLQSGSGVS